MADGVKMSCSFSVSFDNTKLQYAGKTSGDMGASLQTASTADINAAGKVQALVSFEEGGATSGTIASFKFTILTGVAAGTTPLTIGDINSDPLTPALTGTSGSIAICSSITSSITILPTSQSFDSSGGSGSVNVYTDCSSYTWTARSNVSWITITSAASGTGNGTINYMVSANTAPNTSTNSRTGTISIAGNNFTITQSGLYCNFSISPTSELFEFTGGTGRIIVTSQSSCTWTARSNVSWINITSGNSGSGNGTMYYSVIANATAISRTGTISVAGKSFTVEQEGCSISIDPTNQSFAAAGGTGYITVTSGSGCSWTATTNDHWITITSGKNGTGVGTVNYAVSVNSSSCPRTGTITIADQVFAITQQGANCSYSITPEEQIFSTAGGKAYITVTTESCCNWTATSNASWIIITSGLSGTGNGIVQYSVTANSGSSRTGTITVGGSTFTVIQDGSSNAECSTWSDVIKKYTVYVSGQASWNDVITCYNQYASP
jgi:hypothetical protein